MTVFKAIRVECKYKTSRGSINEQEMLTNQYHFVSILVCVRLYVIRRFVLFFPLCFLPLFEYLSMLRNFAFVF